MVKELLLGDNPFIGVSHLAQEKAREEQREATLENKVRVIEAAIVGGATGFTFSTHPANLELLQYIRDKHRDLLLKLNYYILVPYAAKYVREATSVGTAQLIKKIIASTIRLKNLGLLLQPKPINFIKLFLETELEEYLRVLPKENVKAVLLHEVLTELLTAFNLDDIVKELAEHFRKQGIGFGLESRNIVKVKQLLEGNGMTVDYLMTPMNPLGYQMTPAREEAEKTIVELSAMGIRMIAINVFASGAIKPQKAAVYLTKLRQHIYAITIGTSKPQRALENFRLFKGLLAL